MMLNLLIPLVITIHLLSPNQSVPQSAITEANWQSHPKIVEIRRIVSATNSALKQKRYKLTERQFEYCQDQYFTVHRLAKSSQGMVTFYGDYRQITGVTQDQRDYGSCPITARIVDGAPSSILECGGPLVSYPGNFFDNLGNSYLITPDRTFVPGLSRFNSNVWNSYQRPDKRYDAGGFATFDLSTAVQAYAEVMAMKDRSSWQIGPSGDFRHTETINCDNPLLSDQQRSLICRTGNFVGETAMLDADGNVTSVTGSPTPFLDPVSGGVYQRAWLLMSLRNVQGDSIEDVRDRIRDQLGQQLAIRRYIDRLRSSTYVEVRS